jgi:hypothetical protein
MSPAGWNKHIRPPLSQYDATLLASTIGISYKVNDNTVIFFFDVINNFFKLISHCWPILVVRCHVNKLESV